jgi:hypothetical protein
MFKTPCEPQESGAESLSQRFLRVAAMEPGWHTPRSKKRVHGERRYRLPQI